MANLLHEFWENDDGDAEFGVVQEHNDRIRHTITPNGRLVFSLWASSWHEAMAQYQARLGYGEFDPAGLPDQIYTDKQLAEQSAYLAVRGGG